MRQWRRQILTRTRSSRAARVLSAGFPTPSSALLRARGARRACGAARGCPSRRHALEEEARLAMSSVRPASPVARRSAASLLRVGVPVLDQCDRRGAAVEFRVDQEAAVGSDIILLAL